MSLAVADDVEQHAARLIDLWSDLAMRHIALGASCGCGAGGISLRLDDFELDIVDYLEDQAVRSELPAVAQFFEVRLGATHPVQPLRRLLEEIREGQVPATIAEWILPKLERTLTSFAQLHGSGRG